MADNEPTAPLPGARPGFVQRNLRGLQESIRHGVDVATSGVGKAYDGMVADGRASMQKATADAGITPEMQARTARNNSVYSDGLAAMGEGAAGVPKEPVAGKTAPGAVEFFKSTPPPTAADKQKSDAKLAAMLRKRGDMAP
jgi:hypothetical protein